MSRQTNEKELKNLKEEENKYNNQVRSEYPEMEKDYFSMNNINDVDELKKFFRKLSLK